MGEGCGYDLGEGEAGRRAAGPEGDKAENGAGSDSGSAEGAGGMHAGCHGGHREPRHLQDGIQRGVL